MTDYRTAIQEYLDLEREVLARLDVEAINEAMNLLARAYEEERTVFVFGNGGSASTASHFENDFNKGLSEHTEKKFRFRCLNDNVATMLAIANDISFDEIFRFQLRGKVRRGDVVIAISGSGNSKNVLHAVDYAKEKGASVIALTGMDGGQLLKMADISLHAPVHSMQVTEDIHMIFDHLMMAVFYKTLAGIDHVRNACGA